MKAIIPVAGAGTKLRPHTYTQPKALIPLAGKNILSIIVDQLAEAGFKEYIFIIGYLGDKIQDYMQVHYPQLKCHYLVQNDREGLGHAVYMSKEIVQEDEAFIVLGDTICEFDIKKVIESETSTLGVKKVDDPRNFGVAEVDDEGIITRLVEKPHIPKSNLALVGIYKIKETKILYDCLEENILHGIKSNEEYTLTDALDCMLKKGVIIHSFKVQNWYDCGKKDSLLESNATLLKKFGTSIHRTHKFENTIIIPPVSIAANAVIKNSIIGPNVSIGEDTTIEQSIIKDSIIGSYSNLVEIVLDDSLIGSDAEIKGESRSLNIGDNTEIDLG